MVFEEKKAEEWFADRYLPSARLEKSVEAKREWAKQEAGRFSVSKEGRKEGGREGGREEGKALKRSCRKGREVSGRSPVA
jgi:hypothetical protein